MVISSLVEFLARFNSGNAYTVTPLKLVETCNGSYSGYSFDEHWDAVGLTGMGSGIVRAWQIANKFQEKS
jgi:hypothetical protein